MYFKDNNESLIQNSLLVACKSKIITIMMKLKYLPKIFSHHYLIDASSLSGTFKSHANCMIVSRKRSLMNEKKVTQAKRKPMLDSNKLEFWNECKLSAIDKYACLNTDGIITVKGSPLTLVSF